jgi:hypothetical protein
MVERRGAYRDLVGKSERKRPLVRPRLRWEGNIRLNLKEVRWRTWNLEGGLVYRGLRKMTEGGL